MMYARLRATAVRMSPTQFPEGYRMVVEAAQQYGMRRVPDAYVRIGNGVINAFASGHGFRRFVIVHSDLFEVGGTSRDPDALRFVIGHEVGHLAAGHVSYFRQVFTTVLGLVPLLGPLLSRAQEFTADNFGYAIAPTGRRRYDRGAHRREVPGRRGQRQRARRPCRDRSELLRALGQPAAPRIR